MSDSAFPNPAAKSVARSVETSAARLAGKSVSRPIASPSDRPRWGELTAAAAAALVLSCLVPIGLSSSEAADQAGLAWGIRRPFASTTPLLEVVSRLFILLPCGEVGVRAQAVGLLAGVATIALLVARLRNSIEGPGTSAAVALGVAWLVLSRPFLQVATLHPGAALDVLVLFAAACACEAVRRTPASASSGLTLALVCGLAAGVGWPARAGTWPFALYFTLRALRRGERWPLFAGVVFVAGAGVVLGGVVGAAPTPSPTLRMLLLHILRPPVVAQADLAPAREILAWVIDDGGILGLLLGGMGIWLTCIRLTRQAIILLMPLALAGGAALWTGNILEARLLLVTGLVAPMAVAATYFAARFGRARIAVSVVLAVIIVVPSAIVGVGQALRRPVRQDPARGARSLDAAFDPRRLARLPKFPPADPEAAAWWRYGVAIGLAPVSVLPGAGERGAEAR